MVSFLESEINDAGATLLAKNTHLLQLGLDFNNIHDEGAFAIAKNNTLKELYIDQNKISSAGVQALNDNRSIIVLDLGTQRTTIASLPNTKTRKDGR